MQIAALISPEKTLPVSETGPPGVCQCVCRCVTVIKPRILAFIVRRLGVGELPEESKAAKADLDLFHSFSCLLFLFLRNLKVWNHLYVSGFL